MKIIVNALQITDYQEKMKEYQEQLNEYYKKKRKLEESDIAKFQMGDEELVEPEQPQPETTKMTVCFSANDVVAYETNGTTFIRIYLDANKHSAGEDKYYITDYDDKLIEKLDTLLN